MRGQVQDEDGQPLQRVEISFHFGSSSSQTVYSDAAGHFEVTDLPLSQVTVTISKPGFFKIDSREMELTAGINDVSFVLNHETELQEKVEVESSPVQIDPDTTSHQESLVQHEILNIPVPSTHDLQQSLRAIPQVLADSNGTLHVAGARQGQTEILLDGFEVNDPGTGSFNSSVTVDAVREVSVETGGFGAQFAHAGGGIVSIDTQTGDDKLRFGITNFLPDLSIQHGTHFGNWYPRVLFSGPLKKGRMWFSEALTVQHTFRLVSELPSGQNSDSQWVGSDLVRMQVNLTPKNILQGSFLYNLLSDPRLGLGPFTPISTTTNTQTRRYFGSLKDQLWLGRTLFDFGLAADVGHSNTTPLGTMPYVISPSTASGNYFQAVYQDSRRLQFNGDITSGLLDWLGKHTLSAGWNTAGLDFSQQASRSAIQFYRGCAAGAPSGCLGTISETATFSGAATPHLANTQVGGYAQDLWRPLKPIVFSLGVRTDWDRLIHQHIVEPRMAMNWVPAEDGRMKFTLAWGEHYQPIYLASLAPGFDQQRTDTFFDSTGLIQLGPPRVSSFVTPVNFLKQPRSYNTTAEWDERFFASTYVGVAFLLRESRQGLAWETQPSGSLVLQNHRNDRYTAGEAWIKHNFGDKAQIAIDYTRSRASSNEVLDPTLASLILSAQQPGPLLWDAPNRIVGTGWSPIPIWGLLLSGFAEYHTGYPFSVVNEEQQLTDPANSHRFPNYFSLNLGLEKRFPFRGREWAVRISCVNITGHSNPSTVVNDVDAPSFLTYGGGQRRAFTVRLRLVTQH